MITRGALAAHVRTILVGALRNTYSCQLVMPAYQASTFLLHFEVYGVEFAGRSKAIPILDRMGGGRSREARLTLNPRSKTREMIGSVHSKR